MTEDPTVEVAGVAEPAAWHRLDRRMLLVHPVTELGRFLPALAVILIAGSAAGQLDWWYFMGLGAPIVIGVLRYLTTSFRIADGRVELRRGVLDRHLLSIPLDRVRTVDMTARPVHRVLGLATVRIGTGTASTDDEDRIDLDGLQTEVARRLRAQLLDFGEYDGRADSSRPEQVALRLDPAWARFAPLTSTGVVLAAGALGAALQLTRTLGGSWSISIGALPRDIPAWTIGLAGAAVLLGLVATVSALSVTGYLLANWGFRLTHASSVTGGAWHVRRGLLTTRETTLDDARIRGVTLAEPLGLRMAGAARASAIVTGVAGDSGSAVLVPPAPRTVATHAAGEVVGTSSPFVLPLSEHGPRARRRRWSRALLPAVAVLAATVVASTVAALPGWLMVLGLLGLPVAAALAADRARALGHALVEGYVVARSGSLARRRDVLEVPGVIGWSFRATWFQRRAGLTTLAATTAGGRQAVEILDVPEAMAVALAHRAHPRLLDQFLEGAPQAQASRGM